MVTEIIEGIKNGLLAEYPTYKVYLDEKEQPYDTPSFLIINTETTQEQKMGPRYWREHTFDVQYFPKSADEANREFSSVVDSLLMGLEYVKINDDLIRGTKMNSKVEEGKFHFFVNYDLFVMKVIEPIPYMETLYQEDELKIPEED